MALRPISLRDLVHADMVVGPAWSRLAGKRLFITGGTGFVGKWLLETLVYANRTRGLQCQATVLSRHPETFALECPHLAEAPGIRLWRGDVLDFAFPEGPFDAVIHGAADIAVSGTPLQVLDTCIAGTRRVLDCAAHGGAQDLLLLSSGAVYGRQPVDLPAFAEDWHGAPDPLAAGAAYGTGKRAAECLAVHAGQAHAMRVTIARCFAFAGPYLPMDKHFAIGNFIRDAIAGRPITIQGDGTPLRTYLYAADLAAWLWTIMLTGQPSCAYNVGGATAVSIADLARTVNDVLGNGAGVQCLTPAQPGRAPERYIPDLNRARSALGLEPRIGLEEAIRRTAAWAHDEVTA